MKIILRKLFLSVSLLVFVLGTPAVFKSLHAELPPGSYEKLKADAQEKLKIRITQVHEKEISKRKLEVTFKAEVLEVLRSDSGLKPGDMIMIHSYRWTGSYAGPKNPPLLPVGWVGTAFLNRLESSSEDGGDNYSLAAYGASFE
jgi:hypothetical protein